MPSASNAVQRARASSRASAGRCRSRYGAAPEWRGKSRSGTSSVQCMIGWGECTTRLGTSRVFCLSHALWQTCAFAFGIDLATLRALHWSALYARAAAQPLHLVHFPRIGDRHRARHHSADHGALSDERFSARSAHAHLERCIAYPDLGRGQHARRLACRCGQGRATRAGGGGCTVCVGPRAAVKRRHSARCLYPRRYSRGRGKSGRSRTAHAIRQP